MMRKRNNFIKENKGITLIALVITIIILLILAGISISALTGTGLFEKAKLAKQKTQEKEEEEREKMEGYEDEISKIIDIDRNKSDFEIEATYEVKSSEGTKHNIVISIKCPIGIKKITCPDGTVINANNKANIEINYIVENEKQYEFIVKTRYKEEKYILDTNEMNSIIISETASGEYPLITRYGIKMDKKINIEYITETEKYYSLDNGETWKQYTEDIELTDEGNIIIKAKNIINNKITPVITKDVTLQIADDALPIKCYDGNDNTEVSFTYRNYKIYVEPEMYGETIIFKGYTTSVNSGWNDKIVSISFFNLNTNALDTYMSTNKGTSWNTEIVIPENTEYIEFSANSNFAFHITEISIKDEPKISEEKGYTIITKDGFKEPHSNMTIEYFQSSKEKLYKIDDGEWLEYENKPIKVEIGKIIYAKGIDRYGREMISQLEATKPSDNMPIEGYDGNDSTVVSFTYRDYKLYIDPEMYGKTIIFKGYTTNVNSGWNSKTVSINFFNLNTNTLDTYMSTKKGTSWNSEIVIPENTEYIQFYANSNFAFYINDINIKKE